MPRLLFTFLGCVAVGNVLGCDTPSIDGYGCEVVAEGMKVLWGKGSAPGTVKVALHNPDTAALKGWMAIGRGTAGGKMNGEVLIAAADTVEFADTSIKQFAAPDVSDQKFSWVSDSGVDADASTKTLWFEAPEGDLGTGDVDLIVAYHQDDPDTQKKHSDRARLTIDVSAGLPPPLSPCGKPSISEYSCETALDKMMVLWGKGSAPDTVKVALHNPDTAALKGWMAIGRGTAGGGMSGEALLAGRDDTVQYGKTTNQKSSPPLVQQFSWVSNSGADTLQSTRTLWFEASTKDVGTGDVELVVAYNKGATGFNIPHSSKKRLLIPLSAVPTTESTQAPPTQAPTTTAPEVLDTGAPPTTPPTSTASTIAPADLSTAAPLPAADTNAPANPGVASTTAPSTPDTNAPANPGVAADTNAPGSITNTSAPSTEAPATVPEKCTPSALATNPSSSETFACMKEVGDGTVVHWTPPAAGEAALFAVIAPASTGWLAMAFAQTEGAMGPASGVLLEEEEVKGVSVTGSYTIKKESVVGSTPITVEDYTFSAADSMRESGRVTLRFSALLPPASKTLNVNVAFDSNEAMADQAHPSDTRFSTTIDLGETGAREPPKSPVPETEAPSTSSCKASTRPEFDCMKSLHARPMITLHWKWMKDGTAFRLEAQGVGGWLALAFPETAGKMGPATGVALEGGGVVKKLKVGGRTVEERADFTSASRRGRLLAVDLQAAAGDATADVKSLTFTAAVPQKLDFNVAWHATESEVVGVHTARISPSLDLLLPSSGFEPSTPADTNPSSCTASEYKEFECVAMIRSDPELKLHWTWMDGTVSFLLEARGVGGWLALAFPEEAQKMGPAMGVALEGSAVKKLKVAERNVEERTDFVSASRRGRTLAVDIQSAEGDTANGVRKLTFSAAGVPQNVDFNVAWHDTETEVTSIHSDRESISVDLVAGSSSTSTAGNNKGKAVTHGVIMSIIWAYLVPSAILIKRFGPIFAEGRSVAGYPIPFVLHAVLMLVSVVVTAVMAALALSSFSGMTRHSHKELGIVILVFACVQVFMNIAKCDGADPKRVYFRYAHVGLGVCTWCIAFAQMVIGYTNMADFYGSSEAGAFLPVILVGLSLFVVAFAALSIIQRRSAGVSIESLAEAAESQELPAYHKLQRPQFSDPSPQGTTLHL